MWGMGVGHSLGVRVYGGFDDGMVYYAPSVDVARGATSPTWFVGMFEAKAGYKHGRRSTVVRWGEDNYADSVGRVHCLLPLP